jgi:hypothetical protein
VEFVRAIARHFFLTMTGLTKTWHCRFALFILKPWIAALVTGTVRAKASPT